MITRRRALIAAGAVLVVLAVLLPQGWYDALPWDERLPAPPLRGVTLLRLALLLEGVVLLWAGWRGWVFDRLTDRERPLPPTAPTGTAEVVGAMQAAWLLGGITAVALLLRVYHLGSDLWLDEITPLVRYRDFSVLEVLTTYLSSNNHLLNTVLVKFSTGLFGEREWAVRLPAMVLATATIPALYWLGRMIASRTVSLGAALILAVSYHHVFFSQNARGYGAYLLFSLLATGFLVRGLTDDRLWDWTGYVAAMVLNFASLLHSGFVFAAHVLLGLAALVVVWRQGRPAARAARRLAAVFVITAFLGFQLYATMMPQAYLVITEIYGRAASGFSATSLAFVKDLVLGITEGFGGGALIAAVPFLAVAALGFVTLLRRNWVLGAGLSLPLVLVAAFLVVRGLSTSPRFFLLGLPLADLAAVLGVYGVVDWVVGRLPAPRGRIGRRGGALLVGALALASVASLPAYYERPKQAYRATLTHLEAEREADELIVLIHTAEHGFRYYATRAGLTEGRDFVAVRSVEAFDAALGMGRPVVLVTTFRRALELSHPDVYARITRDFESTKRFGGTVHDGTIALWRPRG